MASVTSILRSAYYIAKLLPLLLWIPLSMRLNVRRARRAFENELLRNGLDAPVAHQLADVFSKAGTLAVKQVTSPRSWK